MEKIGRIVLAMVLLGLVSGVQAQAQAPTPTSAPASAAAVPMTLTLSAEQLGVIWAGLQELPGRVADPVKQEVTRQVQQQAAAAARAPTTIDPGKPEKPPGKPPEK